MGGYLSEGGRGFEGASGLGKRKGCEKIVNLCLMGNCLYLLPNSLIAPLLSASGFQPFPLCFPLFLFLLPPPHPSFFLFSLTATIQRKNTGERRSVT